MNRSPRLFIVALLATAMPSLGTSAHAQVPKRVLPAQPGKNMVVMMPQNVVTQPGMSGGRMLGRSMPYVPGYYTLQQPNTQAELELIPDQIKKLEALGKEYREATMADRAAWSDWRNMTPEERTAKSAEMREKSKNRMEEFKKKIETILLPHQIKALKKIEFMARAPSYLRSPRTIQELELTDEQKSQLKEIQTKAYEEQRKLQKKAAEAALKVLTPEQLKKLKERVSNRRY